MDLLQTQQTSAHFFFPPETAIAGFLITEEPVTVGPGQNPTRSLGLAPRMMVDWQVEEQIPQAQLPKASHVLAGPVPAMETSQRRYKFLVG